MKYMNVKKYFYPLDLQLFADGDEGGDGGEAGGDDQDDQDDDPDGDDDEGEEDDEAKFTQKDIDDAVKDRLARERRKWQRRQQSNKSKKPENKPAAKKEPEGDDDQGAELQTQLSAAEQRAEAAEIRVLCLERDVNKNAVADVVVLAQARAKDGLDIEDAIDEVLDDYPHFKKEVESDADDDEGASKPKKKPRAVGGTNNKNKPEKKTDEEAYLEKKYGNNKYFKRKS